MYIIFLAYLVKKKQFCKLVCVCVYYKKNYTLKVQTQDANFSYDKFLIQLNNTWVE